MEFSMLSSLLDQMLDAGIPGYDCAVYYKHQPVFRRSGGFSDRENAVPMRADLIYYIYSATKVLTVTCALQLMERGDLRLTDALSDYLPEYRAMRVKAGGGTVPAQKPITIRDLLCMTGGFGYDLESPAVQACRRATGGACPTRAVVRALAEEPLLFQPGTRWNYSLGHDILGAVIEVVSGQTFGEYMRRHIFEPCGMRDTAFRRTPDRDARFCPEYLYQEQTGQIVPMPSANPYILGPAFESGGAGLMSTVDDYCRFQEAFISGRLLSPETVDAMQRPQLTGQELAGFDWPGLQGRYSYGYGVRTPLPSSGLAPEFGWGGAAGALTMMDTHNDITLFYAQHVLHSGGSKAEPLRGRIKRAVYEGLGLPWHKH